MATIVTAITVTVTLLLAGARATFASMPSVETLRLADAASELLDERDLYADYTVKLSSIRSKPDGSHREANVAKFAVRKRGVALPDSELLTHDHNGEDRTERSRDRIAELRRTAAGSEKGEGERELRWSIAETLGLRPPAWVRFLARLVLGEDWDRFHVRLPGAREATTYDFTPLPRQANRCVAEFHPTSEHRDDIDVARGQFAWDCESGMPLWVEATAVTLPIFVQEMVLRLDFDRCDEIPYTRSLHAHGVGGLLFLVRRFETGVNVTDVRAVYAE